MLCTRGAGRTLVCLRSIAEHSTRTLSDTNHHLNTQQSVHPTQQPSIHPIPQPSIHPSPLPGKLDKGAMWRVPERDPLSDEQDVPPPSAVQVHTCAPLVCLPRVPQCTNTHYMCIVQSDAFWCLDSVIPIKKWKVINWMNCSFNTTSFRCY